MGELREHEIAFIGKITAGITHEINNALASIKEISGLMEDLLSFNSTDLNLIHDKFHKVIPKIQEQVNRGVKLSAQLNKFSHLTYNQTAQANLNNFIEHLIFLTQRFARIKNVVLQYQPIDQKIEFNTNPIQLQMALYNCITYYLSHSDNKGKIVISPTINGEQLFIRLIFEGETADRDSLFNDSDSAEELLVLQNTISSMNQKIEFDASTQSITIKLKLLP